ncbi:MAG: hypothetical protein V4671_01790 [Armatimonadota bacterium]
MIGNVKTGLAAFGLCALAIPAQAGTLSWSGDVDDTATISIQGRDIRITSNAGGVRNARESLRGGIPRDDVRVRLDRHDGRGQIRIIQQPSNRNNYTTIVRIEDRSAGRDRYSFTLDWDDRYDSGRDRYSNGRDRGRDRDWDSDRGRDSDRDRDRDRRDTNARERWDRRR